MEFTCEGGSSSAITIHTDGQYEIKTSDARISITEDNNTIVVSLPRNENAEPFIGSVIVSLTDLKEGESKNVVIAIEQKARFVNVVRDDYDEDENWNF